MMAPSPPFGGSPTSMFFELELLDPVNFQRILQILCSTTKPLSSKGAASQRTTSTSDLKNTFFVITQEEVRLVTIGDKLQIWSTISRQRSDERRILVPNPNAVVQQPPSYIAAVEAATNFRLKNMSHAWIVVSLETPSFLLKMIKNCEREAGSFSGPILITGSMTPQAAMHDEGDDPGVTASNKLAILRMTSVKHDTRSNLVQNLRVQVSLPQHSDDSYDRLLPEPQVPFLSSTLNLESDDIEKLKLVCDSLKSYPYVNLVVTVGPENEDPHHLLTLSFAGNTLASASMELRLRSSVKEAADSGSFAYSQSSLGPSSGSQASEEPRMSKVTIHKHQLSLLLQSAAASEKLPLHSVILGLVNHKALIYNLAFANDVNLVFFIPSIDLS